MYCVHHGIVLCSAIRVVWLVLLVLKPITKLIKNTIRVMVGILLYIQYTSGYSLVHPCSST